VKIPRGTIVWVDLDPTRGHEQRGLRPCLVVSSDEVAAQRRYPLVCVIPITGTPGAGALYPPLAPGSNGLRKRSFALVDQLRSVDKARVRRVFGAISPPELEAVDLGLRLYLGIDDAIPVGLV
jgi:mRNA interferase MazF